MAAPDPDALLTTAEVAALVRRPVGTIRQWRHNGRGPKGFRLAGSVVYRRSAVEAWIRQCEREERVAPAAARSA